ncbi:MAG: hypothetical protein NT071_12965 [Burkholderiales bacterium]|nr:hypothetical protein [Burkholderiales bacterium]
MNDLAMVLNDQEAPRYLGLAPFLRASIAGQDLRSVTKQMLQRLAVDESNPQLLMNLSIAMQCLNQQALGIEFQSAALAMMQTYTLPAQVQPAQIRLLMLATHGSLQANTPLDCLLEGSDVALTVYFVNESLDTLAHVPEHDVLFVGIAESDANQELLAVLGQQLQAWPRPVLNAPEYLPSTGRDVASRLLQGIPHLLVPISHRLTRAQLLGSAAGLNTLAQIAPDLSYPVIVRPLGSQAGADLRKLDREQDLGAYLSDVPEEDFFLAQFVDYSDARGQFRKIRIVFIDGEPFVGHMAMSSNWMIHYVNAGMYEDQDKRREEARFMDGFPDFVDRHKASLSAISERMKLEYLVMDCAETRSGDLLVFEIDHVGVIHAMDVETLFPYKNAHIQKAQAAFRKMLRRRMQGLHGWLLPKPVTGSWQAGSGSVPRCSAAPG